MTSQQRTRWLYMASLILAGDSIYLLPYMRQSFQTSMQEVFDVTFTQLGVMNGMFGVLAITAYFAGGWLSDRVSTRRLLAVSLFATGAGGYFMATIPAYPLLLALHAFWGVTTILTFWAALIKAARLWGRPEDQGRTFGILDGGRGLVGAIMLSLAAWTFSKYAVVQEGLVAVIILYSSASVVAGLFVLAFVPDDSAHGKRAPRARASMNHMRIVARMPVVWLHALVILVAYWLYIGAFEFAAFAEKAFDQGKAFGAVLGAVREWLRPVAAIAAGFLADKIRPTRAVSLAFLIAAVGYGLMAVVPADAGWLGALWAQVAAISIAVFALRGIYFAILQESRVPVAVTGTAVGLISTIGFSPDIYAYTIAGWFVDNFGAVTGFRRYFMLLAGLAVFGMLVTGMIAYLTRGNRKARKFGHVRKPLDTENSIN